MTYNGECYNHADLRAEQLNREHPVTAGLQQMIVSWPSPLRLDEEKTAELTVTRLMTTSERSWKELAYEEALGLAKFAQAKSPASPVDVMFDELNIKRRHEATISKFNEWIEREKELASSKPAI